jgi:hypothetical protein
MEEPSLPIDIPNGSAPVVEVSPFNGSAVAVTEGPIGPVTTTDFLPADHERPNCCAQDSPMQSPRYAGRGAADLHLVL